MRIVDTRPELDNRLVRKSRSLGGMAEVGGQEQYKRKNVKIAA